jgi:hypothetical protein
MAQWRHPRNTTASMSLPSEDRVLSQQIYANDVEEPGRHDLDRIDLDRLARVPMIRAT